MSKRISRRKLLAAGVGAASTSMLRVSDFPTTWIPAAVKPLVISSGNGITDKNGGDECCVQRAYRLMTGGADLLDALIAGVNIVELDPADSSVGYGGLPNADGVVQLDSCCMHGPKKWAGGVACLEGVKTPSLVAKAVMESTDHHLLVGKGAQEFARQLGFEVLPDLNTERSRAAWLEWKRRTDPGHYLDPKKREEIGHEVRMAMVREGKIDPMHVYGTINCNGINARGEICGVTTTSGLAFKIPGRVGDSPILGAGLYVDNAVGAAGSTGRGEANLYSCNSFFIVEQMRQGKHPKDAMIEAMRRMKGNTIEKRLLSANGLPNFGMEYYALDAKGRYAGCSTNKGSRLAVCDDNGPRFEECEYAWS